MTQFKTMSGICVLAVAAACAFGAQGASAQKAVECAPTGTGSGFKDAHCKEPTTMGATFTHVALPGGVFGITATNITTGTTRSPFILKFVWHGITMELQATEVQGEGQLENKSEGATTWAEGSATLKLKNVTVTAPAGKGCKVVGGEIVTKKLNLSTKGLTNELAIQPFEGENLATFTIEGCSVAMLNTTYPGVGSFKGFTDGATYLVTHTSTTAQNTLSWLGDKAGLEFILTIKRASTGNGIALT